MSDMENEITGYEEIERLERLAKQTGIDISAELKKITSKLEETTKSAKAWQRVELARNPQVVQECRDTGRQVAAEPVHRRVVSARQPANVAARRRQRGQQQ